MIHYQDDRVTLWHGDALALLATWGDATVDTVITDPPYSSGGQYRGDRVQTVHAKYVQTGSQAGQALDGFAGDNRDQRSYRYWSTLWLSEALRVTVPGGACALFADWRQLPTTTDALQSGGWVWRGVMPWHKPNGRMTQGRPANNCEYVAWGTNGPRPTGQYETLPGFVVANTVRERMHLAQKPVEVMRTLVRLAPVDGVVLDPFCGSGSTGVAALLEGRRFIGVERAERHLETAAARLRRAAMRPSDLDPQDPLPLEGMS